MVNVAAQTAGDESINALLVSHLAGLDKAEPHKLKPCAGVNACRVVECWAESQYRLEFAIG
eukprot:8113405-Alexandrium_andersonii.AAC.1